MISSTRLKFFSIILIFFAIAFLLYRQSLDYYFFQDDFFEINISKASNLSEYLSFFKFRSDIIAYRPVSLQNYFFISYSIFGLNPVGYRLITFLLFFLTFFLIVKVVNKVTSDDRIGLFAGSLWLTSSIHFMSITWIAAAYNIIGTFFWLSTALLFLKHEETGAKRYYLLTIGSFLITIGSYEFSVTWPVIIGFYYFFVKKHTLIRSLVKFLPFILITITYLLLRLLLIKVPNILEYKVVLNFESAKAFFWYILWSFNIPEEFKKQIIDNLIFFNNKFLLDYWWLTAKSFIGTLWILALGVVVPLVFIFKQRLLLNIRILIFSIFWFFVGILPVLVLPNHTFTMYLTLASVGVYFLIAYLVITSRVTILFVPILLIWVITSHTTVSFYRSNSWMIGAQKTAFDANANLKKSFSKPRSNSTILYSLNSHWEKQALSGHDFARAIYDDSTLFIYYNKYELIRDFQKGFNLPVYVFVPNEK